MNPRPLRSNLSWPNTKPTPSFFQIWLTAIESLPSFQLGPWNKNTHTATTCLHDPSTDLVHIKRNHSWHAYSSDSSHSLRLRKRRRLVSMNTCPPSTCHRGSFSRLSSTEISFEGSAPIRSPPPPSSSIRQQLNDWGHTWIWNNLQAKHGFNWLPHSLSQNSLLLVCDGSYQPKLTTSRGAAAWILECQSSKRRIVCVLPSSTSSASPYRSEATGILGGLLFIYSICLTYNVISGSLRVGCDNLALVKKCIHLPFPVSRKLQQGDLLRTIIFIREKLPFRPWFFHIKGHQDDAVLYSELDRPSQLNVDCDLLAKAGLRLFHSLSHPHHSSFPFEFVQYWVDGVKITSDISSTLYYAVSKREMKHWLVHTKRSLSASAFDSIDWLAIKTCIDKVPQQFHLWVTKQISGFCATRSMLFKRGECSSPLCPICGDPNTTETSTHYLWCPDSTFD